MSTVVLILIGLALPIVVMYLAIEYYSYLRSPASQWKRILEDMLESLSTESRGIEREIAKLGAELSKLETQMTQQIVDSVLASLPISQASDAHGIGESGTSVLRAHGISTLKDLDRTSRWRIRNIDGFGDYKTGQLFNWLNQVKTRTKNQAESDPNYGLSIKLTYEKKRVSLDDKKENLKNRLSRLREGIAKIQHELERYKQVSLSITCDGRWKLSMGIL